MAPDAAREDRMMRRVAGTAAALAGFFFCTVGSGNGQTPAQTPRSSAVASPTYVSIYLEVTVNRPAAEVWQRFGGYCAVAEWMKNPCAITSGKDGELGAVRTLGGGEVLVGKTPTSYTYTQPVKDGQPYNLYHGTFEARPVTATTSKLIYAFIYDNSMLPDDGAREADKARRTASFSERLQNMKKYLEGGGAGR
jgi:polyketide cyclase/dehydrase/lipid transport protein